MFTSKITATLTLNYLGILLAINFHSMKKKAQSKNKLLQYYSHILNCFNYNTAVYRHFLSKLCNKNGSSNKTVKIVVPFTLPEGRLPQEHRLAEFFHAKAYRDAVQWYQPQLRREIMLKKPTLDHCCRMSYDPNLYYNPEAVPIRISQPMNMPVETTYQEKRDMQSNPLQRLLPGLERSNDGISYDETY